MSAVEGKENTHKDDKTPEKEKTVEKVTEPKVEKAKEPKIEKVKDPKVEKVKEPGKQTNNAEKEGNEETKTKGEQGKNDMEIDEDERPLDLAAMRKFEFEQVERLSPAQLRRYEQFRRSDLKNQKIKKVLVNLNPMLQKASEPYIIAVKGLTKLFVGDVVEKAIDIRMELGEKGALQPKHIREAYRRLRKNGAFPTPADKKPSFI